MRAEASLLRFDASLKCGDFINLLRQAKLEALRAEIRKGLDSGPAEESDIAETIDNVKARGRQRRASARHGA